jgi:transcriptional regulator of NAD metabolism
MKKKHKGATHKAILDFLKRQEEPVTINQVARAFGESRNAIVVKIATLTTSNPHIAEDDAGRVYLIKEGKDGEA